MAKKRSISEVKHESDEERLESSGQKSLIIDESHIIRQVIEPVALKEGEKHLKIMSWNVNGLRSLVTTKKTVLLDLVSKHQPDVLCFQETKIQDNTINDYTDLLNGYESYWNCSTDKKGYSGTAIFLKKSTITANPSVIRSGSHPSSSLPPKKQAKLSTFFKKGTSDPVATETTAESQCEADTSVSTVAVPCEPITAMERVSFDFEDETKRFHGEGRTITVEFRDFILVACYVPNSGEGLVRLKYRVEEWEPHMRQYLQKLSARKPVVFTGDLNCGHLDLDIHNPTAKHISKQAGLTPLEREAFAVMLSETRFKDAFRHFYPEAKGQFTYWSVRAFNRPSNKGIRLDYFLCSEDMFPQPSDAGEEEKGAAKTANSSALQVHDSYIVHNETVGTSDHCPVVLIVKVN